MQNRSRDCAALIKHIDVKMTALANKRLDAYGVTFMQMHALLVLQQMDVDTVPLKTLEKHFEVAQSTAAGIVVRLEKKGLIQSCIPADDKRQKFLRLTEKGRELCLSMEEDLREGERTLLMSLTEEEKGQLYRLLKKVHDSMR